MLRTLDDLADAVESSLREMEAIPPGMAVERVNADREAREWAAEGSETASAAVNGLRAIGPLPLVEGCRIFIWTMPERVNDGDEVAVFCPPPGVVPAMACLFSTRRSSRGGAALDCSAVFFTATLGGDGEVPSMLPGEVTFGLSPAGFLVEREAPGVLLWGPTRPEPGFLLDLLAIPLAALAGGAVTA
jgi:hypothetical protein